MAGRELGSKGGFVDETAARAIHNTRALLHALEAFGIKHVARFIGQRHVHGDEVGLRDGLIEILGQFDLQTAGAGFGKVRVVGEDAHAEREGALGHFGADAAHAENDESFAVEFGALEAFAVPLSGFHAGVSHGDFAGDRHEEREGVLGGGDGVSAGGVHDHDAALGGCIDIDIVHANAGAADGFEVLGRGNDVGADLGLTADDEGRILGDYLEKLVVRQSRLEGDVELSAFGEGIDPALGDGVGDKNFRFGHGT